MGKKHGEKRRSRESKKQKSREKQKSGEAEKQRSRKAEKQRNTKARKAEKRWEKQRKAAKQRKAEKIRKVETRRSKEAGKCRKQRSWESKKKNWTEKNFKSSQNLFRVQVPMPRVSKVAPISRNCRSQNLSIARWGPWATECFDGLRCYILRNAQPCWIFSGRPAPRAECLPGPTRLITIQILGDSVANCLWTLVK